ncbi:MAG: GWxTD domain-containing protein, partial [Bacteroidota bacterium]
DEARRCFETVLDEDDESVPALEGLARLSLEERDWGDASGYADDILDIDPNSLEAHYIAARAYRESGSQVALIFRLIEWNASESHFDFIMARDSLYEDVLYEYARLRQYKEEFDRAFRLGHAQIRLKPASRQGQIGLFRIYRAFVATEDPNTGLTWLRTHPSTQARYFEGELLRREQRPRQASVIFKELMAVGTDIPLQAMYLSMVRIAFRQENTRRAEIYYWRAVENINSWLGAELLFEDLKYIITGEEVTFFRKLNSNSERRAFFHSFWERRNPTPSAGWNPRLAEHIRRFLHAEQDFEYFGFRSWFNNPDQLMYLRFPDSFLLNEEFNDKGMIYLRHGDPDQINRTIGGNDSDESWVYFARGDQPQRIFNFRLKNSSGNNWRLAGLPEDREMIEELAMVDRDYRRLFYATPLERLEKEDIVLAESRTIVMDALTTDEHTWNEETRVLDVPYSVDTFRSDEGKTLVDISFGVPLHQLGEILGETADRLSVEVGLSIGTPDGAPPTTRRDTLYFASSQLSYGYYLSLLRYRLQPNLYRLSMHVNPLGSQIIGRWMEDAEIPDYSSDEMMLSDIQFLLPSELEPSIEIEGVKVVQSPFGSVPPDAPLYVYHQIYNLVKDVYGKTAYTVRYFVAEGAAADEDDGDLVREETKEGIEEFEAEFEILDLDDFDDGAYTLRIQVTARKRVHTVSRSRTFFIESE